MNPIHEIGSWIWYPDRLDYFVPARIRSGIDAGQIMKVQTEDGEEHKLSPEEVNTIQICNTEVLSSSVDNLIHLNDLNENAILHNLRIRYKEDMIYTYVSSILISVNPFKLLPLYTPAVLDLYRQGSRGKPPHVFAVAFDAYSSMLSDQKDQSVVISGESGSGKSEATKLILQFLADVSSRASSSTGTPNPSQASSLSRSDTGDAGGQLEQQVLGSNPIMEAFGNAKTVRNNNSSRFGKLITIRFDRGGSIVGGLIVNYLLEKVRVVHQNMGERNYHIFYQLLAAGEADQRLKAMLHLDSPEMFHITNQSDAIHIAGVSDEKEFEDMRHSMDTLNFSSGEQMDIMRTVAGVLQFGNLNFISEAKKNADAIARIDNLDVLEKAASLWQIDIGSAERALTSRNIGSRSTIIVSYSQEQAKDARDAMVKRVYALMFQWIIGKINTVLGHSGNMGNHYIGVLDIFGFESFKVNSFEQLCINYCNEKLQFHFNEHIFRLEQEAYASEGVIVPNTAFKDNQPTLDLLELRGDGVFAMIDDELNVPKGSDDTFLNKAKQKYKNHPNFVAPKPKDVDNHTECFGIRHYAGEVYYTVAGFLEKDKDSVHADIVGCLRTSSMRFITDMFPAEAATGAVSKSRAPKPKTSTKTVGCQFKEQLQDLMDTLNSTFPHFVRCMKPNDEKSGDKFTSQRMLDQLRYAGLLEVCRIRKLGYPVRKDFDDFFKRYRCIVPNAKNLTSLIAGLVQLRKLQEDQWAKGNSKMFMRNQQSSDLELAREEAFVIEAKKVQKVVRGFILRCKFRQWTKIIANLRRSISERMEDELTHWLDMSAELPYRGIHLTLVQEAKRLLARIQEEKRAMKLLSDALKSRDLSSLRSSVSLAEHMNPPFLNQTVVDAKALIQRIELELKLKSDLQNAMKARSLPLLNELLSKAAGMAFECDEVRQATALKHRIEEEEATIAALVQAIAARSLSELNMYLQRAQELGLDNPTVHQSRELVRQIEAEIQAVNAVVAAVKARDLHSLLAALERAKALGLTASVDEIRRGLDLKVVLEAEVAIRRRLAATTETRDLQAINLAIREAEVARMTKEECSELLNACNMRDIIIAENNCLAALREAVGSNDFRELTAALSEASRLGLTGQAVDAARSASKKLSVENEMRVRLADLAAGADIDALEHAITEASRMGLSSSPEFRSASGARDRIQQERALIAELEASMSSGNSQVISNILAQCTRMGIGAKYNHQISAAKDRVDMLNEQAKAIGSVQSALRARDLDALESALALAVRLGVGHVELESAERTRTQLKAEKQLIGNIQSAIASKSKDRVSELLLQAEKMNISSDVIHEARVFRDRAEMIDRTKVLLQQSCQNPDMTSLNIALESALQLGIEGYLVDDARRMRDNLRAMDTAKQSLTAMVRSMEVKAMSRQGIVAADIQPLVDALLLAATAGVPSTAVEVVQADAQRRRLDDQLQCQDEMEAALQANDRNGLKDVLDKAEDLGLKIELVSRVKQGLKNSETEHRQQKIDAQKIDAQKVDQIKAVPPPPPPIFESKDVEAPDHGTAAGGGEEEEEEPAVDLEKQQMEAERQKRHEKAVAERYRYFNYHRLRNPDDFAKGVILNKKKVKEQMLRHQDSLITKSLVEIDKELNKIAMHVFKDLLGYMGDKQMSFPATLAQDILQKGSECQEIRDEIYLQIIKQLTGNPRPESIAKGWQMMCMCVSTFPPSVDFELFLYNFILEKTESKGAVRNYAKYCLRTLDGMVSSGECSGFVPTVDEIQAYKERPPILASIFLVDGQTLTEDLPITPDLNVGKVLELCYGWLGLTDPRMTTFGMYVYDVEGEAEDPTTRDFTLTETSEDVTCTDLPRTPRPLRGSDFMGDVLVQKARQKRSFRFVLKKKIFLRQHAHEQSDDAMFARLTFLQAEDEIITQGNVPIATEEQVLQLASISIAVAFGEEYPSNVQDLVDQNVTDFLPVEWRNSYPAEDWAAKLVRLRNNVISQEVEELQWNFVESVEDNPLYGVHFFYVKRVNNSPGIVAKLPRELLFAFNADGLHVLDWEKSLCASFGFADIHRWGGSSSQLSLVVCEPGTDITFELILATSQAVDISAIMHDYIKEIMANS